MISLQAAVSKAALGVANAANAPAEYDKHMGPDAVIPSAPVHAARLSSLLKTLANAEGAVSESIKARRDLITGLEKLLETNRSVLSFEESQLEDLSTKKAAAETKKRDVEDEILRKLPSESPHQDGPSHSGEDDNDEDRPQVEELTPPPMESSMPIQSPKEASNGYSQDNGDVNMGNSEGTGMARPFLGSPGGENTNKRRKIETEHEEFVEGDALADLDEDVAALLRAESGEA